MLERVSEGDQWRERELVKSDRKRKLNPLAPRTLSLSPLSYKLATTCGIQSGFGVF